MNAIELRLLRNAEYLQYVKDYSNIIFLNNVSSLNIQTKYDAFNLKIAELEAMSKKASASEKTQELVLLDEKRDNAINGIYYFLLGYSYHYEADKKENAELLLSSISLYGSGISRLNYQAETSTLNNLIRDWENKAELVAAIAQFGLQNWVNELKTNNEAFNSKYLSRTQEYGNANPETIKAKREETNTAYYALRDRIDALHLLIEVEPSPYSTVINQLNALTDQYNLLLANRKDSPGTPPSDSEPEQPQS